MIYKFLLFKISFFLKFDDLGSMDPFLLVRTWSVLHITYFLGPLNLTRTCDMDSPFQTMHMPLSVRAGWKCSEV